jgi:hypothetical protein
MVHIFDDFFDVDLEKAQKWALSLNHYDTWYENSNLDFAQKMLDLASNYFDLSEYIGCEMHINRHTPNRHYDKDELHFKRTGEFVFPLCGIVWYNYIDEIVGGEIVFPDIDVSVKPKTDRLIIFQNNLLHEGKPFQGTRMSVGINPWSKKPLAYSLNGL